MSRVWIVGSVNMDKTVIVKSLPVKGETIGSIHSFTALGGKGSNQSGAAAWTGIETYLIGAVGMDDSGNAAREILEKHAVDLRYLGTDKTAPTGNAIIFVDENGDNFIVVEGGANQKLEYKEIPFKQGDYVGAQLEVPIETIIHFFESAKSAGATTVLNPSPYQEIPERLLKATDILIANEVETEGISNIPVSRERGVQEACEILASKGISKAVITLGEEGAVTVQDGILEYIDGEKVTAVDTQGAGDAFMGVMLGYLGKGKCLSEAARKANHIAAQCVQISGSTLLSLPEKQEE